MSLKNLILMLTFFSRQTMLVENVGKMVKIILIKLLLIFLMQIFFLNYFFRNFLVSEKKKKKK